MSPQKSGPQFLADPSIEFPTDQGAVISAYVALQARKAVRDVQPRPDLPIFFYLDEDGFPVGVRMYAPIPGRVVVKLVDEMFLGTDGKPGGMDRRVECDYVVTDETRRAVEKLVQTVSRSLEAAQSAHSRVQNSD